MIPPGFSRAVFLSHVNSPGMPVYPGDPEFELRTATTIDGDGFYLQEVRIGEHSGTHWGAPAHFDPAGATADALSAEDLIGPAAVIDVRAEAAADPDRALSLSDLRSFEGRNGRIPDGAFFLMHTGFDERWSNPTAYVNEDPAGAMHFPGFARDAADWLIRERGVRGIGTDTMGVDPGSDETFAVNRLLLHDRRIHLENLANLGSMPPVGGWVVVGGMRNAGGSGGPATVFGLVP